MAKRLLDRQVSLLHYLTSGGAIYGANDPTPLDPALWGVNPCLLRVEARFSHEKRMEKIVGVFRRTFELLGSVRETLVREFVDACPPAHIDRLENARQFYDFLSARWRHEPPVPPHLPDVAACELAFATARVVVEIPASAADGNVQAAPRGRIRRTPGVVLLRSAYDIRPIFEDTSPLSSPARRDIPLAVVPQPLADQPRIFELAPAVFDLLSALDHWTDRAAFDGMQDAGDLVSELAAAGLAQVSD